MLVLLLSEICQCDQHYGRKEHEVYHLCLKKETSYKKKKIKLV